MEADSKQNESLEDEEEHVLLHLDERILFNEEKIICGKIRIPVNAPYVLSGLDSMNPVLVIGEKLKLIGEYQETIGTCYVFSETEGAVVHEETGASDENLFMGRCIEDPNQELLKQINPMATLHKILNFRLSPETHAQAFVSKPVDSNL